MAVSALDEVISTTRELLNDSPFKDQSILGAGRAALTLLSQDPETCLQLAYQQLHAVPFKDVKTCWRRLYTDAALWKVLAVVENVDVAKNGVDDRDWLGEVVELLDMALILTGAAGREELVEAWFDALDGVATSTTCEVSNSIPSPSCTDIDTESEPPSPRPAKRIKLSPSKAPILPPSFPDDIPTKPTLRYPICRARNLSMSAFQAKVSKPEMQTPLIIEGAIAHWPAFEPARAWKNPSYLLRKTLHGRRLVPVEIGRSYTDENWGQKILSFREFMERYMLSDPAPHDDNTATHPEKDSQKGYLAQHDLLSQIPSLRADIAIPDYCFTTPASQPTNPANIKPVPELPDPLLNAWFGPAGTISPLHTDPYHNILAQVVGYKYVRLYAPEETARMYPRGVEEGGIDMGNTSRVDLGVAMGVWGEVGCWGAKEEEGEGEKEGFKDRYPLFREAEYVEGVLGPGECLYIPVGWWHYVRSLTPSFSVSFWWN